MPSATEQAIDQHHFIELMRARDIRAMEILYDQYSPVLYGVICWITNDESKSEEILYKTFTYIWNHFYTFDESVHNICLWMVNIARRFSFETLGADDRLRLKNLSLPSQQQAQGNEEVEILHCAFFKGMSVEKMAEKFDCTESRVRALLHDAVDQLKKEYIVR